MTSPIDGLFPYINKYTLKTLAARNSPPTVASTNTDRLAAISQTGMLVTPYRTIIMVGQAVGFVSQAVILLLILTDSLAFWHLIASAIVMGSIFPFIMPARQAIVVNIVGKEGLTSALALSMAGMNATRIVGPAAGGFLISFGGVDAAYALGVGLFLTSLGFMGLVERSRPTPRGAPQFALARRSGMRHRQH